MSETPLTANQAARLRAAHLVTFVQSPDGAAMLKAYDGNNYLIQIVPVENSRVEAYDGLAGERFECFAQAVPGYFGSYGDAHKTWQRQIKAGSRLSLRWIRANQNVNLDEAGLVRDELRLTIQNGKTVDTYLVSVQVGRNNTARMVRLVS